LHLFEIDIITDLTGPTTKNWQTSRLLRVYYEPKRQLNYAISVPELAAHALMKYIILSKYFSASFGKMIDAYVSSFRSQDST